MKTWSYTIIFLFICTYTFAAEKDGLIKWYSLKEAREKARVERRPMIVDFAVAQGCPRCEAMQKNVYSKKEIADKINRDFIPVLIDLAKELTAEEKKLGDEYDFKNDCLLLFLDPAGRILKDPSGKRLCFMDAVDTEVFLKILDLIRSGIK